MTLTSLKRICWTILLAFWSLTITAQNEIKNFILMVPDGTSTAMLSVARWYQQYMDSTQTSLNIDPYICGLVTTFCSNAPIGDSAPTTSCYVTGQPSQKGYIATYPPKTDNDLVPIDATRAYQPLVTLFEAAKILNNKAVGLVVTCEFPHATPADCMAHTYNRAQMKNIAKQMVYNQVDVIMGGGVSYLTPELINVLKEKQYDVILNDLDAFKRSQSSRTWALFGDNDMPYDIDRDPSLMPSLAEMTHKALELLQQNENGFFLLVEGSKVDFAGHKNEAVRHITDFIAFDQAVKEVVDFAKKDGHTLVIMVPDHGNGGINLGNNNSDKNYAKLSLKELYNNVGDKEYIGYTTKGHTGEDVFLGCYHPTNDHPSGVISNVELYNYLCNQLNMKEVTPSLTEKFFAKHQEVFHDMPYTIEPREDKTALLTVKYKGKTLSAESYTNYVTISQKRKKEVVELSSIIAYMDVNNTFYLPKDLRKLLE